MKLQNLKLTIENVTRSKKGLEVVETSVNRIRLDNGTYGKEVESYSIHCLVNRGDILKVKVGKEFGDKITKLSTALRGDAPVYATFEGLKLTAYAMQGSGKFPINSGVSGKAEDFEFIVADNFEEIIM